MKAIIFIAMISVFSHQKSFGNTMVYGETSQIDQLDPFTSHEIAARRITDLIFDDLISTGPTGKYEGRLAESWSIEDSGASVKIQLKKNIFWHNTQGHGSISVSSDDVIKTVLLIKNKNSQIPNKDRFDVIKSAEKIDDLNVRINFQRALGDPLRVLMFKILPSHILKDSESLKRDHPFAKSPIGTGPYILKQTNSQGEIRLQANPEYFKGPPNIQEIIMKPYSDQNIMAQSLMYSSLDLITYVSPRDLTEIIGDNKIGVVPYDALSFTFFAMNNRHPVLKKKRVRQAISHAINREEMLEAFFHNRGTLITGPFPPTSWAYNLKVKGPKFNPSHAEELLKAAGLKKQGSSWLNSKGEKLSFVFSVPIGSEGETIKRISLAFKSYLEKIDIDIKLKFMDWSVWKKKVLGQQDFDLTIASWSFDDASNITSLFHSSHSGPWGNNFVGFQNTEVDMMLTEANATNDFDKRRAIYQKLHFILADESPYAYLWTLMHHAAHQTSISHVRIEPQSFFKHVRRWTKQ